MDALYFRPDRRMLQLMQRIAFSVADAAFIAFLVLVLCTPAWRTGPFTWWPVWPSPLPPGASGAPLDATRLGLLSLLPVLCVLAWGGGRLLLRSQRLAVWQWKTVIMMLPLLVLSLLILRGLDPAPTKRTIVQVGGLALFWFSFLYVLDRRPGLTVPLLLVVMVQAGVAIAQFGRQRDLGLAALGEFPLDPQVFGTSVLWSGEEVWLRGYGLTAHPNVLGAMLAVLLLVLLPQLRQRQGWQLALLGAGLAVGLLGLLVSFSRTGWLAFLAGLIVWVWNPKIHAGAEQSKIQNPKSKIPWLPFLLVPVFLLFYHDLILSRWTQLDTAIEARSIQERLRDAEVALALIGAHPWTGVGAGNELAAAQAVRTDAGAVHSVSLLVTAELGILGGVSWLLFMLLPLLPRTKLALRIQRSANGFFASQRRIPRSEDANSTGGLSYRFHLYTPAWVGLLIAGLFDTPLWLTTSWRAALLLGLLAALQSRPKKVYANRTQIDTDKSGKSAQSRVLKSSWLY